MTSHLLVAFPHAGAGPSFFARWPALAPPGVDVVPVGLPGREKRFTEAPLEYVSDAVDDAVPQILDLARDHAEVALFGHSLGAILAYETARRLADTADAPPVTGLFVSGSKSPASTHDLGATGLADDAFLETVERATGYRHAALGDPRMRRVLLPCLRADIAMHERYRPSGAPALGVPLTAVRGADDHIVTDGQLAEWKHHTTGDFHEARLRGGHMYVAESPEELLGLIGARLREAAPREAAPREA